MHTIEMYPLALTAALLTVFLSLGRTGLCEFTAPEQVATAVNGRQDPNTTYSRVK